MVYWFVPTFVGAALQAVFPSVGNILVKALKSRSSFDDKLEKVKSSFSLVQSLMHKSDYAQPWETLPYDFEDLVYEVNDLSDDFGVSEEHLGAVQEKLNIMVKALHMLQDRRTPQQATTSIDDGAHVVGRESDFATITSMINAAHDSVEQSNIYVIAILGIFGVGKTTLARMLYNHDAYTQPFQMKIWISVSTHFDATSLTRAILAKARHPIMNFELHDLDSLQCELRNALANTKFLLVLDDLWNVNPTEWDRLLGPLKLGSEGSTVIVTTGNRVVSSMVCTTKPHEMMCLNDQDCWQLLKGEVFGYVNAHSRSEFAAIGFQIAQKCKGLPLTAKIVGRYLRSKEDIREWKNVLNSSTWRTQAVKREILSALKWGYGRLALPLRRCFAFCSIFSDKYTFEKDNLVRMLIAAGFIVAINGEIMPEDTASCYMELLFENSFFLMEGDKYMIQDAIHKLAQSVVGEKYVRVENTDELRFKEKARHLSLVCETGNFELSKFCKALRSFVLYSYTRGINTSGIREVPLNVFDVGTLRLLDLSGTQIVTLTENIGNLKHLHFLDISNTSLMKLPESVGKLNALETLKVVNCLSLVCLPKSTGRLNSLRHLDMGGNDSLTSMPSGIGHLTGLQTLSEFIVGSDQGQIKELKNMNSIRGSLCIKNLENVENPQGNLEVNLADKRYLEKLELRWTDVDEHQRSQAVLDNLMTLPTTLKEFVLMNYGGVRFPDSMVNSLFSNLESIHFLECPNCLSLPCLGNLPKLKFLKIVGMHMVEMVTEVFLGYTVDRRFQSLETLEFRDMHVLKGWVGLIEKDMENLRRLTIANCPEMTTLPSLHHLGSLKHLEFEECPKLPSLPDGGLPRKIGHLSIADCDLLEPRCSAVGGADWMKIAHIPQILINGRSARDMTP